MKKHRRAFKIAVAGMVAAGFVLAAGMIANHPEFDHWNHEAHMWYWVHIEKDPLAIAYDGFLKEADRMSAEQRFKAVQR